MNLDAEQEQEGYSTAGPDAGAAAGRQGPALTPQNWKISNQRSRNHAWLEQLLFLSVVLAL